MTRSPCPATWPQWWGAPPDSARASGWTFPVSQASADYVQPFWDAINVTVIGRHLFDRTNGWDGNRPPGTSWSLSPTAVTGTSGCRAPGRTVPHRRLGRGGQALSAGLVDEVAMDVVPVVLGEGVRFYGLALR
jgi:hypothetical protein